MRCEKSIVLLAVWLASLAVPAASATFGLVAPISGQAADLALDEPRGVLYIANFTAARIDVLSLGDNTIRTSMHVAPGPSSLAISQDGHYLVATHFGNVAAPGSPGNALTVIDLSSGARQTFTLDSPPLGAAFGADGMALVATTGEFLLLDPASGQTQLVDTVAGVTAATLPAAPGTPPVQIVAAAMAASADGRWIFGLTDTIRFSYDVAAKHIRSAGYTATPPLGPRVVSVARDGSYYAAGWGVFDRGGELLSQFANALGALGVGSLAVDSAAGVLYAQIPVAQAGSGAAAAAPPVLSIVDADNLTVREQLRLPENLAGRSLLNAAGDTVYAVSESGVLVLPVGALSSAHRLAADREDLVFSGNFCVHGAITRTLNIVDPGGGQTSFSLATGLAGVTISPSSGRTPAAVQVTIDPVTFSAQRGTVVGALNLSSPDAVNLPPPVRILVNNRRPDERGSFTDVPGILVDLLADPARDRFYVLRQDLNQVLVFDGSALSSVAALRTANTPTRMAITFDQKYLLIGHDNSQLLYVYDLDTLQQLPPVALPLGHYPRSVAASGNAILAASRVVGAAGAIDRIDLASQTSAALPSLGVFQNTLNTDTVLAATPDGGAILAVSADGTVTLYDAADDTFIVSRKLPATLSGAFAASGSGQFLAGNTLLNSSLVPVATSTGAGFPAGFAFVDGFGIRMSGPQAAAGDSGIVEHVDLATGDPIRPTRLAEQPLVSASPSVFTRTLAPLANRNALIALTVSGFTAMAWNYDAATVPPAIGRIVNAADLTSNLAAGSLISVFGSNLNPVNMATQEVPLPTAIGESCLTANGSAVPMMFASPGQVNAQLPLHLGGSVVMTLYTPGGVSDDYYVNLLPLAPAIFLSGTAGPLTGIPVVVKDSNQQLVTGSNPIRSDDAISIYATGLGPTSPEVAAGMLSPASPLAAALQAPDVRLGGVPLQVGYAGLAPGQIGVYQINARAPAKAQSGIQVPLTVSQGGVTASILVRVVE
ncbi:MAG TPA: hypothetical protein VE959_34445 [Bryobacteraceae bacterium]|nr:hypothetical protein [Bryobacteraceae bacterium]